MALTTTSSECKVHEELVREKVKEILAVETQQKKALEIAKNAWDSLPDGPHRRIATIKGIGIQTACALVAKIVTIDRFQSPKALIGYFGCFPEQTADCRLREMIWFVVYSTRHPKWLFSTTLQSEPCLHVKCNWARPTT